MTTVAVAPAAPAKASANAAEKGFFALDLLDNRYPSLHGLRVLAIVSVVQFHVTWIFAGEQHIRLDGDFTNHSLFVFFGMDLFFILSGFLIGSILLRSLQTSGTQNLKRFYIRRVFRTFPSYYVVLTILAIAMTLTDKQLAHLPYEYIYGTNFLDLGRDDVIMFWGWSLALEEQFYLTVPILFFALHRLKSDKARIGLLAALWALGLAARLYIFLRYAPWGDFALYAAIYFRTYTRFDTLVAGILLAFVHARYGDDLTKWLREPFHRALVAMPALACLWLLLRPTMFGGRNVQLVHVFAWGSITSVMWLCVLVLLLHGTDNFARRFLSNPIFRRLATLGYGVYLVHIPLIDHVVVPIAHRAEAAKISMAIVWPLSLTLVMALSFVIGYAMHLLIEKPSLKVRERLSA